jgi:hypothetical protein
MGARFEEAKKLIVDATAKCPELLSEWHAQLDDYNLEDHYLVPALTEARSMGPPPNAGPRRSVGECARDLFAALLAIPEDDRCPD